MQKIFLRFCLNQSIFRIIFKNIFLKKKFLCRMLLIWHSAKSPSIHGLPDLAAHYNLTAQPNSSFPKP